MREEDYAVFATWVQLSDLHVFDSTVTNLALDSYRELARKVKPDFLVATGDFRHKGKNPTYTNGLHFLEEITAAFGLEKKDVFLIPGNHDAADYPGDGSGQQRRDHIELIAARLAESADAYLPYLERKPGLLDAFEEYRGFVRDFYGDAVDDARTRNPAGAFCIPWNDLVNLVHLNTCLLSDGDREHPEIIDTKALSELSLDKDLPTLVLGHHVTSSLHRQHQDLFSRMIPMLNARAYLCGDAHKLDCVRVPEEYTAELSIPCLVCGKAAPEENDDYSDVAVLKYTWRTNGRVYVQAYKWGESPVNRYHFVTASDFIRNTDENFSFKCPIPSTEAASRRRAALEQADASRIMTDFRILDQTTELFFDDREHIRHRLRVKYKVIAPELTELSTHLRWLGSGHQPCTLAAESRRRGYKLEEEDISATDFRVTVRFPKKKHYGETGEYVLETRLEDMEHSVVPWLACHIIRSTDKLTLRVTVPQGLVKDCWGYTSVTPSLEGKRREVRSEETVAGYWTYSWRPEDLDLLHYYCIRWLFAEKA